MKLRIPALLLFALCLAAVPAVAQIVYSNGPINGTTDGWTISFGFAVSDTFTVGSGGASINGLTFGAWVFPGDVLPSAEILITSSEFGGTTYFDERGELHPERLRGQPVWLQCLHRDQRPVRSSQPNRRLLLAEPWRTLTPRRATRSTGMRTPVPLQASENSVGTIPSESFTLLGGSGASGSTCGSVPEPGGIMLFGFGILSLAGSAPQAVLDFSRRFPSLARKPGFCSPIFLLCSLNSGAKP